MRYPLQTHEMLFDAHNHAFRVVGGVPRRGICDNMKTAVDRIRKGKARDINTRFKAMVSRPSSAKSGPSMTTIRFVQKLVET